MIQVKFDGGHYLDIYDPEFKILETTNGLLWNATEEEPISVDKQRYNNGDYVLSEEPLELKEELEENIES